jgi:flagellar biosynthesis GTPase FlhF
VVSRWPIIVINIFLKKNLLTRCRARRGPARYSFAWRGDRNGRHSAEGEGRGAWRRRRGVGPRVGQGRGRRSDPPAEGSDGGAESGDGGAESGPLSYTLSPTSFFWGNGLTCALQVADFASRTASGALTAAVSAEVERLRTQHADAVREKSASDSKCRKLTDRVAALEREKADLRRQLAAERREANEAIAKEQAAQAEAKLARAEGNLAKELAEHLQERLAALESRAKGAETAMRAEAERTRAQLKDTYRELGARTGDFEVPDREPGLRCLQWV